MVTGPITWISWFSLCRALVSNLLMPLATPFWKKFSQLSLSKIKFIPLWKETCYVNDTMVHIPIKRRNLFSSKCGTYFTGFFFFFTLYSSLKRLLFLFLFFFRKKGLIFLPFFVLKQKVLSFVTPDPNHLKKIFLNKI